MAEPRQRWRLLVRRGPEARDLPHRDVESLWEAGLVRAGIPAATTGGGRSRPRIVFAAPVPVGMTAECEPIDLLLEERVTIADLRSLLRLVLPPGYELTGLHDVWLGEPSIAGRVVGADYRVSVADDPESVRPACAALLASRRIERPRPKAGANATYDLRPLIAALEVLPVAIEAANREGAAAGTGTTILMRLRHDQELGNGRPEEVLAVLGDTLGRALAPIGIVRERVRLAGEPDANVVAPRPI